MPFLPYSPRLQSRRTNFWLVIVLGLMMVSSVWVESPPSVYAAEANDVGYRGFSYGTICSSTPTGEKPESKLWWNDGIWWGSLCNPTTNRYHIHRLDVATQQWIDTGTRLDSRPLSKADTLWDAKSQKLYVASHLFTTNARPVETAGEWGRLYRYSYNSSTKTYSLDTGFPVTITKGKSEALVLDKDSTGQLWVTYVESGKVMINHSTTDDLTWGEPVALPVDQSTSVNVDFDDISSLISFGGNKLGVMWSNQLTSRMYFAVHHDGDADDVWHLEETALPVADCTEGCVDDHINLAADNSGRIFAATKTNFTRSSTPHLVLLTRDVHGKWTSHTYDQVRDYQTRPVVVLDEEHERLYMFATSPEIGGTIYYKSTALDTIQFSVGRGEPFIQSATDTQINNATSTKQNVNSKTGLVVLASDSSTQHYLHNYLDLRPADPESIQKIFIPLVSK